MSSGSGSGSLGGGTTSLHDDLVTPVPVAGDDTVTVQRALTGGGDEPKVFYLRYADGTEQHTANYDACTGKVPKFECTFAPTLLECQRQIQAYLDDWYADFNIIFTLTRPTSGKYYTEVVSSGGGGWCKADDKVAGVAPFLCKDLAGGVAYTFQGGRNARETAIIIAQEQAHLLGLQHTTNPNDIMFPTISASTTGFPDDNAQVTRRSLRHRQAELVQDDEEGARRLAGRSQAVAVRVRGRHAGAERAVRDAEAGRRDGAQLLREGGRAR